MNDQPIVRRVHAFPIKIILECEVYVLAPNADDAYTELTKVDLQDLLDWDEIRLSVQEDRMAIKDIHTTDPEATLDADDGHELSIAQYDPQEHPDFLGVSKK